MTAHRVPLWAVLSAILAAALLGASPPSSAAADDAAATHAYIHADLRVVQFGAKRIRHGEATLTSVVRRISRECPHAGANSPQNPESTEMSNEVIGLMVTSVIDTDLPSIRAYLREAGRLRWSSSSINRTIKSYLANLKTLTELPVPHLCADVRAWAASGYTKLPASTLAFSPRFMDAWVALGEIPSSLRRFESASDRALVRLANRYESELTDFEAREVANWGRLMTVVELNP